MPLDLGRPFFRFGHCGVRLSGYGTVLPLAGLSLPSLLQGSDVSEPLQDKRDIVRRNLRIDIRKK